MPTIWVLRAPRDMGGLSANAVNPDSDLAMRYVGGVALEYDVNASFTTGFNIGGSPFDMQAMKATECSGTVAFSIMAVTSEGFTAWLQNPALACPGVDKFLAASY